MIYRGPLTTAALSLTLAGPALAWPAGLESRLSGASDPNDSGSESISNVLGGGSRPLRLDSGATLQISPGEILEVLLPPSTVAVTLDPDIIELQKEGPDRLWIKGLALGEAVVMLRRSQGTTTARVQVVADASGSSQNLQRGGRVYDLLHPLGAGIGERQWALDSQGSLSSTGFWQNTTALSWNDQIRDVALTGNAMAITTRDRLRFGHLQAAATTDRYELVMGDQLPYDGLMLPIFGIRPSMEVSPGLSVNTTLGAGRAPLDPFPAWGDPMVASAGATLSREAGSIGGDAGLVVADNEIAPLLSLHGHTVQQVGEVNMGASLGGGQVGDSRQARGNAWLRHRRAGLTLSALHLDAGDPVLLPLRSFGMSSANAQGYLQVSDRVRLSANTSAVRQVTPDQAPISQILAGATVQARLTDATSATAFGQRFFPSEHHPGRWFGGLSGGSRTRNVSGTAAVTAGGTEQPDMIIWRSRLQVGARGPLRAEAFANSITRTTPQATWKSNSQIGIGGIYTTRRLMLGARSFALLTEVRNQLLISGLVGVQPTDQLRVSLQAIHQPGRQTMGILGLSARGRPVAEIGDRALGLSGALTGVAFIDQNANGIRDEGEPGLAGVEITLGGRTTLTDDEGAYRIGGISDRPRPLSVRAEGWQPTVSVPATVTGGPAVRERLDVGFKKISYLGGSVFFDRNGNGLQEPDERAATGVKVKIRDQHGTVVAQLQPGLGFMLPGLSPGSYTVEIDPLSLPPDVRIEHGLSQTVEVRDGEVARADFPLTALRSVSGRVYIDVDGDGVYRPSIDQPLSDRIVEINVGDRVKRTMTSAVGSYSFREIPRDGAAQVNLADAPGQIRSDLNPESRSLDLALAEAPPAAVALRGPQGPIQVGLGEPLELLLEVEDTSGDRHPTEGQVQWSFEPENLYAYDSSTLVGLAPGPTYATARLGDLETTVQVTVEDRQLAGIAVDRRRIRIYGGQTLEIEARPVDSDGRVLRPVERPVLRSTDLRVIDQDSDGTIRGLSGGEATVLLEWDDLRSTAIEVEVLGPTPTSATEPSPAAESPIALMLDRAELTLTVGSRSFSQVSGLYRGSGHQVIDQGVTWTTSDSAVALVDERGVVTGRSPGSALITAQVGDRQSPPQRVTVEPAPPLRGTLSLGPDHDVGPVRLRAGTQAPLSGILLRGDGTFAPAYFLSAEDCPAVMTVDEGVVTAHGPGLCWLRAEVEGDKTPPLLIIVEP